MLKEDSLTDSTSLFNEDFLEYAMVRGFENLHFKIDSKTGLKAIIAIHSTKLGPALGGCRFIEYADSMSAVRDAMRLARGMSYKSASVNLPLGGGKAVIIKPKGAYDRVAFMQQFGAFVEQLNGRYITALDSGTELADMDVIGEYTNHVASLSKYNGDPSPYTAQGVFKGIQAAVAYKLDKEKLEGLHIAVQGLGHVGYSLCKLLHNEGVKLTVSDIQPGNVQKAIAAFGATAVETDKIHQVPCDVFSPCALGAVLNERTIPELETKIVAGAANNQLANAHCGRLLHDRDILFAVDYVINAGGLIYAASKYFGDSEALVSSKVNHIYDSLTHIFVEAESIHLPISEIADSLAQEKIG